MEVYTCKSSIKIADPDKKENREEASVEINGVAQAETHETAQRRRSTRKHPSVENIPPRNKQK